MARKSRRAGPSGQRGSGAGSDDAQRHTDFIAEAVSRDVRKFLEEQEVTARIIELVHETYGPSALRVAWDDFRCADVEIEGEGLLQFTEHSPFLKQFVSWLAHTWTPAKLSPKPKDPAVPAHVPSQTFLARQPDVEPHLVKYLNACMETPFSVFEVLKCEVGRRFFCRDLICGMQNTVIDAAAATLLRPHQILYARIIEVGDVPVIDAAAPWVFPEDMKPAILAFAGAKLEPLSGGVHPAHARHRLRAQELELQVLLGFHRGVARGGLFAAANQVQRQPAQSCRMPTNEAGADRSRGPEKC